MKVNDFLDFPVPEPQYKIPITKSAEEPFAERLPARYRISSVMGWTAPNGIAMCQGEVVAEFTEEATHGTNYPY
ncbi:hypothetical protein, partial [Acetobacter fallax]